MNLNKKITGAHIAGSIVGNVLSWFVSAGLIMWGWSVVAPHINAPLFTFWEIFAIRMAIASIVAIPKVIKE